MHSVGSYLNKFICLVLSSFSEDEEMEWIFFLPFHLSIGFGKHVSEALFVIYTRAWAPKFILPHMETA